MRKPFIAGAAIAIGIIIAITGCAGSGRGSSAGGGSMNFQIEDTGAGTIEAEGTILVAHSRDNSLSVDYKSGTGADISWGVAKAFGDRATVAGEHLSYDRVLIAAQAADYAYLIYPEVMVWTGATPTLIEVLITIRKVEDGTIQAQGIVRGWGDQGSLPVGRAPKGFDEAAEQWATAITR